MIALRAMRPLRLTGNGHAVMWCCTTRYGTAAWQLATSKSTHNWGQRSAYTHVPYHMAVIIIHAAMLSHAYLSVSCGRLALLLNLE